MSKKPLFLTLALLLAGISIFAASFLFVPPPEESLATSGYKSANPTDLFAGYETWEHRHKTEDHILAILQEMALSSSNYGGVLPASPQKTTLIDINGDGLVDLLYHDKTYGLPTDSAEEFYAVLLNKGDLGFEVAYKCAFELDGSFPHYYGDCADADLLVGQINYKPLFEKNLPVVPVSETLYFLRQLGFFHYQDEDYSNHPRHTFSDINGDGLVDFLYHEFNMSYYANGSYYQESGQYGVLLNKGDLNFEEVYYCDANYETGYDTSSVVCRGNL